MIDLDKVVYTGKIRLSGEGRDGTVRSSDGKLNVALAHFASNGDGTNPEQLLAAGWSACYLSAMRILAKDAGVVVPANTTIDAEIDLGQAGAGYQLQARFSIDMPGLERAVVQSLADKAHTICPYSKALHGNIRVVTQVV